MTAILGAELSRLRYRRRVLYSIVAAVVMGLLLPVTWMPAAQPLTAAERADAMEWLAQAKQEGCYECTLNDMLRTPWGFSEVLSSLSGTTVMMALFGFLVVIVYSGSDISSGALATQLTFTPRRGRVLAARVLVGGALSGLLMLLGMMSSTVVSVVWYLAVNGFGAIGPARELLELLGASVLYGLILGLVATLFVFIFNSSAGAGAVTAVALLGTAVVELFGVDGRATALSHLMPISQGIALIDGKFDYYGYGDDAIVTVLTRQESVIYHVIVIGLLWALAHFLFVRRDIKA